MKKLAVFFILMIGLIAGASAQHVVYSQSITYDTLTNTDNGSYPITVVNLQNDIYTYSVQVLNDSISGSGTTVFYLMESNDNSHWNVVSTSATDSLSYTKDGYGFLPDNTVGFTKKYLKLYADHTGSGVDRVTAWIAIRKLVK